MKFIKGFFIHYLFSGILLIISSNAFAQRIISPKDTTTRSQLIQTDSLTKKSASSSGLNSKVSYKGDTVFLDFKTNIRYLIGKARVIYGDFELDADYIRLDQNTNEIFAKGSYDSITHRYTGRPIFKPSGEPPFTTDSLAYNYESKKGKSYQASSQVEDGYIHAAQLKKNEYNEAFIKNALYTTCDADHPHFGIHITRGIITDRQIITGPAYLEIEGVPLPIGIPFGFFPKTNHRASGLLFPTFGEDYTRGFFMRDLGYYIGLNDIWDTAIRGTLYSKGSYEGNIIGSYRKNYKYDGRVNFHYASTRTGIEGTPGYKPTQDFNIQWSHNQRPEANPGTTFSASVNVGTSNYFSRTAAGGSYDINQITQNSMSSSIGYGRSFANGLFNFTSSLRHNQDMATKSIYLQLPDFNLSMLTINPFDSKDRVGEQKWYQRLTLGYNVQGSNSITTKENLLFQKGTLQKFSNGVSHSIPVALSLNVLKFFQLGSSVRYNEKWYLQSIRKNYDPVTATVVKDTLRGFNRAYDYSLSTGLSTKVYGMLPFKKGKILALRHVMTPNVSFSYRPDFGSDRYGFYRNVQANAAGNIQRYSIFEDGIYGSPGIGRSASMGFALDNTISAKLRKPESDTVSTPKKIDIIQGLTFSGSYNFVADSFKLTPINFSGRTSLFKQSVGINFFGTFDPYKLNTFGQRVNQYAINDGKIARLTNFGLSFSFGLNSEATKKHNNETNNLQNNPGKTPAQQEELSRISRDPNAFVDFKIPWNVSASYSFNYSKTGLISSITNAVNLYGDLNITPKWKVQYTTGYDFQATKISITQLSIFRDLHCWDMAFNWVPFGTYRSYSFDLKVRASILQDLKLSRRRDYYNNY
ncbi:MAG TPA: hypothetical protein DIT07_00695 [Sphingobacteriaceae bacterium]|nr:hypothetical protein [Sphingobacteriaceae bacterium]